MDRTLVEIIQLLAKAALDSPHLSPKERDRLKELLATLPDDH